MADSDEKIPKGRPPRNGQFQPGRSGNPRGRPKGAKNFRTLVLERLEKKVTVVEQGRSRSISMAEAMAIQLVNKATSGDMKSLAALLALTRDHIGHSPSTDISVPARAEDSIIMSDIIARMHTARATGDNSIASRDRAPDASATNDANSVDDVSPTEGAA